jgi:hypothetical protein
MSRLEDLLGEHLLYVRQRLSGLVIGGSRVGNALESLEEAHAAVAGATD